MHDHPGREHSHDDPGHSHGLVDPSITRSRAGIKAVSISLVVLTVTTAAQTAIPLGVAFFLRSAPGERWAGMAVVETIFVTACVALVQTILRFIHPHTLTHLWWLAAAGGSASSGTRPQLRPARRSGKRPSNPALVADGNHARVDGFVSLGVLASAAVVALGVSIADPLIGLVITLVILHVTWQSWHTVRATEPSDRP
jgi:hypothetical protein